MVKHGHLLHTQFYVPRLLYAVVMVMNIHLNKKEKKISHFQTHTYTQPSEQLCEELLKTVRKYQLRTLVSPQTKLYRIEDSCAQNQMKEMCCTQLAC